VIVLLINNLLMGNARLLANVVLDTLKTSGDLAGNVMIYVNLALDLERMSVLVVRAIYN